MSDLRQAAQTVADRWDSTLWKTGTFAAAIADLRAALAMHQVSEFAQAQEQAEPVAWIRPSGRAMLKTGGYCTVYASDGMSNHSIPLYTTPPQQQAEPATCVWSPEDEDFMPGTYRSACGELWSYVDGGWKDNRVNFCHGCGGKVVEAAHHIQEAKS